MPAPEIFAGPMRVHFFASGDVQSSTPCRAPLRSVVPVSIHPPLGSRAIDASPIGRSEKIGATGFASAAGITVARSAERRVGKEGVSTFRSRGAPEQSKKNEHIH